MTRKTPAQSPNPQAPDPQSIATLLARFSEDPDRFTQTYGAALYRTTCQACHMEDGLGDQGAGAHPPLADNPKMMSKHYVAGVILTGYHGMPRFGNTMSDDQVAAVTNHVRTHFGNTYDDPISAAQVASLPPPEEQDRPTGPLPRVPVQGRPRLCAGQNGRPGRKRPPAKAAVRQSGPRADKEPDHLRRRIRAVGIGI